MCAFGLLAHVLTVADDHQSDVYTPLKDLPDDGEKRLWNFVAVVTGRQAASFTSKKGEDVWLVIRPRVVDWLAVTRRVAYEVDSNRSVQLRPD